MQPKRVSRAIIYDDEYRVLLAKRGRGMAEGKWALVGGKPESEEELPIETAVREVHEEVNLRFDGKHFKTEVEDPYIEGDVQWEVDYFYGKALGHIALLTNENTDARYFAREETQDLDVAFGHDRILDEFYDFLEKLSDKVVTLH